METPDRNPYVYCKEHDIFFNPQLREAADKENAQLRADGLLERVDACPMCRQQFALDVANIHAPASHAPRASHEEEDLALGTDH